MSGGILMCGVSTLNDTTLYFVILNNINAELVLHCVELRYVSQMNSVVYITGGRVYFEGVKMDKQTAYYWVNPLINVNATVSPVSVHFLSSNITNCHYSYTNTSTSLYKSAVIFFTNTSTNVLTLTISFSSFRNNTFHLSNYSSARGGICHFYGPTDSSVKIIFYFLLFFFFYNFVYFILYIYSYYNLK
jgi:hypothetical protein